MCWWWYGSSWPVRKIPFLVNKEAYFLDQYIKPCTEVSEKFPLRVGDDCAIIKAGSDLLTSTDSSVEGIHFPKDLNPYFIAYRSIAIAASDIIAMGSYPEGYLLSITHPDPSDEWFSDFTTGINEFNKLHNTKLIGGDLSKGPLNICVTVFGSALNKIVMRNGARENDDIHISNVLGLGKAGHDAFIKGDLTMPNQYMKPELLSKKDIMGLNTLINSAIDISDGLLLDLKRVCKLSEKGANVVLNNEIICTDYQDLAAGDDYVLLFTADENNRSQILELLPKSKIIGKIIQDKALQVEDSNGLPVTFDSLGWDSFKS